MTFNSLGYTRFTIPALDNAARQEFESLVFDPYTGGRQRYQPVVRVAALAALALGGGLQVKLCSLIIFEFIFT